MKYRLGYTTGSYDLFHIGHLNLLKNAKNLCDFLIVGVNTDEVTYSYKEQYPVIPLRDRIEIIRAIKYVDLAIPQENIDKLAAWKILHYDVLFHGDDRKGSKRFDIIKDDLNSVGVDLVFIPYTKSISSSQIKKKIDGLNG